MLTSVFIFYFFFFFCSICRLSDSRTYRTSISAEKRKQKKRERERISHLTMCAIWIMSIINLLILHYNQPAFQKPYFNSLSFSILLFFITVFSKKVLLKQSQRQMPNKWRRKWTVKIVSNKIDRKPKKMENKSQFMHYCNWYWYVAFLFVSFHISSHLLQSFRFEHRYQFWSFLFSFSQCERREEKKTKELHMANNCF